MSEPFPFTSSGSQWVGITDRVMGGVSTGSITREVIQGKECNVLRGQVSTKNNGGFIQMATDLSIFPAISLTVDASSFDGIEIDALYDGDKPQQSFNIHLRNPACLRQFSSYRATFQITEKISLNLVNESFKLIVLPKVLFTFMKIRELFSKRREVIQ